MTNSFINIITRIILVMVRMMINDVRPACVQWIVIQPTCPPLASPHGHHTPHIALVWQSAGGDHPPPGPGAGDQGGQGVPASLHPPGALVLGRHVPAVHGVVRGALAHCEGGGLATHL